MKQTLENMEDILDCCINGFHQYVPSEPFHLSFASQNLCGLLSRSKSELVNGNTDLYSFMVHSEDRMKYAEFLRRLSLGGRTRTLEYRLVKKDGGILHVSDTIIVGKQRDSTTVGYSVLTDITKSKSESQGTVRPAGRQARRLCLIRGGNRLSLGGRTGEPRHTLKVPKGRAETEKYSGGVRHFLRCRVR